MMRDVRSDPTTQQICSVKARQVRGGDDDGGAQLRVGGRRIGSRFTKRLTMESSGQASVCDRAMERAAGARRRRNGLSERQADKGCGQRCATDDLQARYARNVRAQ